MLSSVIAENARYVAKIDVPGPSYVHELAWLMIHLGWISDEGLRLHELGRHTLGGLHDRYPEVTREIREDDGLR